MPALTVVITLPSIALWSALGAARISDAQFVWGLLLAAAVAAVAWPLGHHYGVRMAVHRRDRLTAFLTDPSRG